MTVNEFLDAFKTKYPDTTEIDLEILGEWLDNKMFTDSQLDMVLKTIIKGHKYKQAPNYRTYVGIWNNDGITLDSGNYNINDSRYCMSKTKKWSVGKILNKIIFLRDDKTGYDNWTNKSKIDSAMDFVATWGNVWSEWGICKDIGMGKEDAKRHIEFVKECIILGHSFKSAAGLKFSKEMRENQVKQLKTDFNIGGL